MSSNENKKGIDQAKKLLLHLRNDFLIELPERIDGVEPQVLALEKSKQDSEIFETLYREMHSLKGTSGTHGLTTIAYICHQFEDALTDLGDNQDATPELIDTLLTYLDMIRRSGVIAGQESPDYSEVETALDNIRQRRQKGKCVGLIVESSSFMSNLYIDSIDHKNVEFSVIEDGLEALKLLLREKYDFVIMGSETKSLNGTALLYALQAAGGINKNIQTVVVTSKSSSQFINELAPDYYLHKDSNLFNQLATVLTEITSNT